MDPLFNAHHPKRVPDSEIDKEDIIRMGRDLMLKGLITSQARLAFEEMLNKAQPGGITREEVHEILQKLIFMGKISRDHARSIAIALGLKRKDFINYKGRSEANKSQQNQSSAGQIGKNENDDSESLQEAKEAEIHLIQHKDREAYNARKKIANLKMNKTPDENISNPPSERHLRGYGYKRPGLEEEEPGEHWREAA